MAETTPPRVRYEHRIRFKAVHHLRRSNQFPQPVHGHTYVLVLGFVGEALELPDTDTTLVAVAQAEAFVEAYMNDQDLSTMEFQTTPLGLAWYVGEHLAAIGPAAGLVDIAITVDETHRYVYQPEWAQ